MPSQAFASWAAALLLLLSLASRSAAQDSQDLSNFTDSSLVGSSDPNWAVSPGGLLEKLLQQQASVQSLSAELSTFQASLSDSEVVFASAAHHVAAHQDEVLNLSTVTHANRDTVHKVAKIVSSDAAIYQTMGDELELMRQRAASNENISQHVAEQAKQLNSLGDVKNKAGGCLDAVARTQQGSHLQMWDCLKGRESQQWSLDLRTGRFQNRHGICVAAPTPDTVGSSLLMWHCKAGSVSQNFSYDEDAFAIKTSGDLCLTAVAPTEKGSGLSLATCTGGAGQQWDMAAGTTGLRQRLDDLNAELWTLQSPTSTESMDAIETEIKTLETGISGFLQKLSTEAMSVLSGRLRHRANNLRTAIDRLGAAASDGGSASDELLAPERPDGDMQPLGADLGLAA